MFPEPAGVQVLKIRADVSVKYVLLTGIASVPHRLLVLRSLAIQSGIATEHRHLALLIQSTEMSANLVFINIDWKSSRMNRAFKKHMKVLA